MNESEEAYIQAYVVWVRVEDRETQEKLKYINKQHVHTVGTCWKDAMVRRRWKDNCTLTGPYVNGKVRINTYK